MTKVISFLLAILFFTLTALSAVEIYAKAVQSEETHDILESYITENGYRAVNGSNFRKALSKYLEAAVKTKLVFKNGSKSDFENFKKLSSKQNKNIILSEKENLLEQLTAESGGVEFYDLLEAVEEGTVSLKKLGNHKCYVESGTTFYQGGNRDYITDKYGQTYYDYYDYYAELQSRGEPISTTVTAAVSENRTQAGGNMKYDETVTVPQTRPFYYEDKPHSQAAVPSSVREKAKDPDNIIEICSLQHATDNEKYDGYYEFFIDETKLEVTGAFLNDTVRNYSEFKEKAEYYKNEFNSFSHAFITVADKETNKVIFSNHKSTDGGSMTLSKAESEVSNAPLGFEYLSGSISVGEKDKGSLAADNISAACQNFTNNYYMPFLSQYELVVTTDSFFNDKELADAADFGDPFESALASSKAEQKEVNREIAFCVSFFLMFLIFAAFLVSVAGKTPESEKVKLLPADKIFTLLRTAINGGLVWLLLLCVFYYADLLLSNMTGTANTSGIFRSLGAAPRFLTALFALFTAGVGALVLDWLFFIARHLKNRSLLKNSFIVWFSKKIKIVLEKRREALQNQPEVYKDIFNDVLKKVLLLVLLPNVVVGIPCVFSYGDGSFGALLFGFLLAVYDLCALGYAVYYAFGVRKVFSALEEMRKGSADIKIDTSKLPKAVRCAAIDAVHLGEGLKAAVENAVKEEKMKAELITNVSHDLKTPLTSIINYSDLLSRCDITDETAKSYIAVLNEKSVRLKKLIEDLVEASKASSGAIKVELTTVSLAELARQLEGEYEDEFESKGLELVVEGEQKELRILADGKLCYRVLDNLMCNIKKYAMPNTRVYMTLSQVNGGAKITLKNISANRLNISPEELKARFVRGDEARSSEGNGLGLSIADNLCTLQGGKLELEIIGDLFCASVTFKSAN